MSCMACGSQNVEFFPREFDNEPDLLTCYECGYDEVILT
jgi:DNA-directed RNA polymerase subunit RPC12/RpoP